MEKLIPSSSAKTFLARSAGNTQARRIGAIPGTKSFCSSSFGYQPYPTTLATPLLTGTQILSGGTQNNFVNVGKEETFGAPSVVFRERLGATFKLDGAYAPTTLFSFRSIFTFWQGQATVEPYMLFLYLSNTDDAALYSTMTGKTAWDWEDNLDTLIGQFATNVLDQSIQIPYATLSPFFGGNVSFVMVTDRDRDGSGGIPRYAGGAPGFAGALVSTPGGYPVSSFGLNVS